MIKLLLDSFINATISIPFASITYLVFPSFISKLKETLATPAISDIFITGAMLFLVLLTSTCALTCLYISLKRIFTIHYVFIVNDIEDKLKILNIDLDEENMISRSYVEFTNGNKIPVRIRKINLVNYNEESNK